MLDIKTWLETTGLKVAKESFYTAPPLPYILFMESFNVRGADSINKLAERSVRVELYGDTIDETAEGLIETLLNNKPVEFTKENIWIASEKMYETIYEFDFTEKL